MALMKILPLKVNPIHGKESKYQRREASQIFFTRSLNLSDSSAVVLLMGEFPLSWN
jgi:hypothetical protein